MMVPESARPFSSGVHLVYFVLDRALTLVDVCRRLTENGGKGIGFLEAFEVVAPGEIGTVDFDGIRGMDGRVFSLRARLTAEPMQLRGEFLYNPDSDRLLFHGFIHSAPSVEAAAGFSTESVQSLFSELTEIDLRFSMRKLGFEAMFQFASMAILVAGADGRVVLANDMALSTFGYDMAELTSLKVEDLMPARFRQGHVAHRERFGEMPQSRTMGSGLDLHARRKDGTEFPVEISLGHYRTDEGVFVIAYIVDITKRREIELAILKQQEEMARVNGEVEQLNAELEAKVEQRTRQLQETMGILERSRDELEKALSKEKELSDLKTRFVSMASHEFRTPLSTILSSASLVARYTLTEEQDKRDKHIQRIRSAVSNLTDILNEFLSIGRLEEGRVHASFAPLNLREQVRLVCSEMQSIRKPGQRIMVQHSGPDMVNLDLSLLRNIIINLVSNALKFSPEDGVVGVDTKVGGGDVTVAIRDSGIGISEDDQKHLFERFFRGKNAVNIQGTGLGLHIVSKYVEIMRGRIDISSELEKGTTITITFDHAYDTADRGQY